MGSLEVAMDKPRLAGCMMLIFHQLEDFECIGLESYQLIAIKDTIAKERIVLAIKDTTAKANIVLVVVVGIIVDIELFIKDIGLTEDTNLVELEEHSLVVELPISVAITEAFLMEGHLILATITLAAITK